MKSEYDFSKAEKGKFYHPDPKLHFPLYRKPDILPRKDYPLRGMPIKISADFDEPLTELLDDLEE